MNPSDSQTAERSGRNMNETAQDFPSLELAGLVTTLAGALESASPDEFYRRLMEQIIQTTRASGAAVWIRKSRGSFERMADRNWEEVEFDPSPERSADHDRLLEEAAGRARASWVEIGKNSTLGRALLLAPVRTENETAGMLELLIQGDITPQRRRNLLRLSMEFAEIMAGYLMRNLRSPSPEPGVSSRAMEGFVAQIHRSLDPREIAYLVANDGKRMMGCDQVMVAFRLGSWQVGAVSGALHADARSPLVEAGRNLCEQVGQWGECLEYQGNKDESLPPAVQEALDRYLKKSNSIRLVALPLRDDREPGGNRVFGVVLAESFNDNLPSLLKERLGSLEPHLTPALANAILHANLPLGWLTGPLAHFRKNLVRRGWTGNLLPIVGAVLMAVGLILVRLPLRSEAVGQLVPQERRVVYANLNGKIVQLAVGPGDRVEKGQELLFIEDLETQLKVDQLTVKIGSLGQRIASLDEQLAQNSSTRERGEHLTERIKAQFEMEKTKIERDLILAETRNPRKSPLTAPVAGQVLTFDAQEKLLGKTVKVGDPLLRVAAVTEAWEVELFIPEREVGRVREALRTSPDHVVDVDLLLASDPHRVYRGKLSAEGLAGETTVRDTKVVLPARVSINDPGLVSILDRMPVGVEVHARVACGRAPAGYVWFSELWNFIYERLLF